MKKISKILSAQYDKCPYGLPITHACKCAGNLVEKMFPIDLADENYKEAILKNNNDILNWQCKKEKCKYAHSLFLEKDNVVECGYDQSGLVQNPGFNGSPLFTKMYGGIGLDGLYSYPLNYYSDNVPDRGLYYGKYNLESPGSAENDLVKEAQRIIEKMLSKQ